jgi:hypothetical protein
LFIPDLKPASIGLTSCRARRPHTGLGEEGDRPFPYLSALTCWTASSNVVLDTGPPKITSCTTSKAGPTTFPPSASPGSIDCTWKPDGRVKSGAPARRLHDEWSGGPGRCSATVRNGGPMSCRRAERIPPEQLARTVSARALPIGRAVAHKSTGSRRETTVASPGFLFWQSQPTYTPIVVHSHIQ